MKSDKEKLILLQKYLYTVEINIHNVYISQLNNMVKSPQADPYDILRLFKAKVRWEAYKEFVNDIETLFYK